MWYAISSRDVKDSLALRKLHRPAHLARLQELAEQNRVLIAGPLPAIDDEDPGEHGFVGSLVVVEFDSLEQAQSWADDDPYLHGGVYKSVTVQPFKLVLP
jgi:uncharacterized protein YciI